MADARGAAGPPPGAGGGLAARVVADVAVKVLGRGRARVVCDAGCVGLWCASHVAGRCRGIKAEATLSHW